MATIVPTVEFYFSDKNLLTDVHLHGLISRSGEGWVHFNDILKFPKLRRLVQKQVKKDCNEEATKESKKLSHSILAKALLESSLLEINTEEDGNFKVRRSIDRPPVPYLPKENDPLLHLVLDSGGLIHSTTEELRTKATNFWTIPEVLGEIRDKKTRQKLEHLPFELRTKEPSDEAMKFVVEFSKLSGEYGTLSFVDLKLLALAYHLEKQESGDAHLRSVPINKQGSCQVVPAKKKTSSNPITPQNTSTNTIAPPSHVQLIQSVTDNSVEKKEEVTNQEEVEVPSIGEVEENVDEDKEDVDKDNDEENEGVEADEQDNEENDMKEEKDDDSSIEDLGSDDEWDPSMANKQPNSSNNGPETNDDLDKYADAEDDDEEFEDDDDDDDEEEFDDKLFHGSTKTKNAVFFDQFNEKDNQANSVDETSARLSSTFSCSDDDFPSLGSPPSSTSITSQNSVPKPVWGIKPQPAISGGGMAGGNATNPVAWHREAGRNPDKTIKIGGKKEDDANLKRGTEFFSSGTDNELQDKELLSQPPVGGARSSRLMGNAAAGVSCGGIEEDDGIGWFGASTDKSDVLDPFKPSGLSKKETQMKNKNLSETSSSSNKQISSQLKNKSIHKKVNHGKNGIQGLCLVARSGCVTTDYAMQSILIQIGLRLLSVDGKVVRRIQQFVLRCNACFQVQSDTNKLFCDRCGSSHLSRIASSIDRKTGQQQLHLKKDFKYQLQGTQYSLPKAGSQRKGRFGGEVVLREDQMLMGIWAQKTAPKAKEKTSMFGAEVNEKTGVSVRKSAATVVVGYGRSNPNAIKGRERRGKKKR